MASEKKHLMEQLSKTFDKYKEGFFFPSDDIDPKDKGDQWCLGWQQAIWSLYLRGGCYNMIQDYNYLQDLRLYGAGRQPNGVYMGLLLGYEKDGQPIRSGWLSTNWEIFSPAPKLHREIRGRFEKQEYDYVATAIDPTSQLEKENRMWDIWYNSQYGDRENKLVEKIRGEVEQQVQYIAQSLDELEMFKNMKGIKLQTESEMEVALDITDDISDIKTIKQKCVDDLVDWNKAAFRDYYDPISGQVKYEYVDWENLIIDFSQETDFKDIRFWSYVKFDTINNVRVRTGLSEDELVRIAKLNCGSWGNMIASVFDTYNRWGYRTEKGVRVYDQFRVPILVSEWVSTDTEYKTVRNKYGREKVYEQPHGKVYNTENKKTKITSINNVYQSSWIIGSDHVYDNGISLNTARPDPKNPRLSIHAVAIPGKSIIESIRPILDQIELGWLRWQSAIAKGAPAGYDFDLSQLEDVSVDGGKTLNTMEIISLYRQTGDTLRRSTGAPGTSPRFNNAGKPITRNEGGIGSFFNEIMSTMSTCFHFIYEITGVDLVSAASAQKTDMTATEVKFASAATSDALQPLYTSWIQLKEDAAITASCKIKRAIKHRPEAYQAYYTKMGRSGVEVLKIGADMSAAEMGIKLEVRPTDQMKAAAIEAATKALQPGKNGENINLPDWWYFVDMVQRGRAKHAIAILNYRLEKSKQESIKLQQENMQMNGQNATNLQQEKNKGKMMEIQAQGSIDMKAEAQKALLQMHVGEGEALNEVKKELILSLLQGTGVSASATPAAETAT